MATTRSWVGGQHDFFAATSWTPTGQPVAGDTAVIGLGTASNPNVAALQGATVNGIGVVLDGGAGAADPAANPTLSLSNATIAGDAAITARGEVNFQSSTSPAETIAVQGMVVNQASISETSLFDTLTITLANLSVLGNMGGTISGSDYGTLNIEGVGYNQFYNNGTVSGQGTAIDVGTQVLGTGAFDLTDGAGFRSSGPHGSTLEFHQGVSSGQTVSLTDSTLILDSPMSFLGTIDDARVSSPSPYGGNSSVLLAGAQATGLSFQDNVLTVSNGGAVLAQLAFAPGLAASDFTFNSIPTGSSLPAGTDIHIQLASANAQAAAAGLAPPQNQA